MGREPRDSRHGVPAALCDTALGDGPELPLPCRTHNTKCSWNTGFLLSGTVFVFCLHFQSASGTMDIFGRETSSVLTFPEHAPAPAAVAGDWHSHLYGWLSSKTLLSRC